VDGKWDLGILANLEAGPMRPTHLCQLINEQVRETGHVLDRTVLIATLKRMTEDGLVEHREVARFPRATMYSLTPEAYEMLAAFDGLDAWYEARRRWWQQQTEAVMHGHRLLFLRRSLWRARPAKRPPKPVAG
jgi:DNA-binding HxlR family transcriptional regulator